MFESARLTDAHTLEGFDCGKESLNTWLIAHARRADSSGVAHVYVWTPLGEQKVSAYFAICPTEVVRNDDGVSGSMAGGYSRIPGYLIARMARFRRLLQLREERPRAAASDQATLTGPAGILVANSPQSQPATYSAGSAWSTPRAACRGKPTQAPVYTIHARHLFLTDF